MTLIGSRVRAVAVVAVAILGTTAGAVAVSSEKDARETTVFAEFTDASPLIVGNDVKTGGVKVGRVSSITVRRGIARVGLHLDGSAMPLHQDARVTIRPVSLLGERFLALDRGSPSAPLMPDGGVIPAARTGRSTDLDEVLNAVDQPTGKALAALLTTLGEGARGHGKNADAAVQALAPAMTDTRRLVELLEQQNDVLTQLIDRVQPVTGALAADDGKSIDQLISSAHRVLATTGANRTAFDATLAQLPATLDQARRTLGQLTGTADATTPTLAAIRPTTDNLTQISAELQRFADSADPALTSLQPVLDRARQLIDDAAPVVRTMSAAGPDLRATLRGARPVAVDLMGNLRNVLDFIRGWALTTNGYDGLSHYFRANLVITTETVAGAVPGGGDVVPKLPTLPKLPAPQLPSVAVPVVSEELTGLTAKQENSLLDYLIGGQG